MKKNIIIIGCGAHAAELVDYIEYANQLENKNKLTILGLIDDSVLNYESYSYQYDYLGSIKEHIINPNVFYLMGIAGMVARANILKRFKNENAKFISYIHPTALVSKSAVIGEGTVISHNVSIGPKAIIGNFNVINSRCTIGHDTSLGENNFLSPQIVTGGGVQMGNHNFLGTNSCVIPRMKLGNHNKIMAGMTIVNHVGDEETIFYRYKEKLIIKK